jgi:hypothetical protein
VLAEEADTARVEETDDADALRDGVDQVADL